MNMVIRQEFSYEATDLLSKRVCDDAKAALVAVTMDQANGGRRTLTIELLRRLTYAL
jgi:hypothetical protein